MYCIFCPGRIKILTYLPNLKIYGQVRRNIDILNDGLGIGAGEKHIYVICIISVEDSNMNPESKPDSHGSSMFNVEMYLVNSLTLMFSRIIKL